jgi:TPR repeat protein
LGERIKGKHPRNILLRQSEFSGSIKLFLRNKKITYVISSNYKSRGSSLIIYNLRKNVLQVLILPAFILILVLGFILQSLCLASNSENELHNSEPSKKRQRIAPLSPFPALPLLDLDQWNTLAEELLMQIFDQLDFHELKKVQRVCKEWQRISNDNFFSLSKQIRAKPLYILLDKLKKSDDGKDGLYQEFFASPEALHKVLSDSTALGGMLSTSALIPFLFESQVTASAIHEPLYRTALEPDQQTALEAYVKTAPVFPSQENIFSQAFVDFTKTYAAQYKALYLLALFNLPSGKPIKALLKRVNQEIRAEEVYSDKNEEEAILLPRAMAYFPNIPHKKAYNIAEYCWEWAQSTTRDEWLSLAELFFRESARQGDADAQLELSELFVEQGKFDESEGTLLLLANQGNIEAQLTLALHYYWQEDLDKAEVYYRLAAIQGAPEAQHYLGILLQKQDKFDEAEVYYHEAAMQEYLPAQNNLGLCLEKKGDVLGALRNYERAAEAGHKFACLNLAYLLEQHPGLFHGSQEERLKRIAYLRDQDKAWLDAWCKARGVSPLRSISSPLCVNTLYLS